MCAKSQSVVHPVVLVVPVVVVPLPGIVIGEGSPAVAVAVQLLVLLQQTLHFFRVGNVLVVSLGGNVTIFFSKLLFVC